MTILAALAAAALGAMPAPADARPPAATPITIGTSHQLRSAVLGDTREINIWLPTGYDGSTARYPVVYLLDGGLDQDFGHIAGLGQLGSLSWTFGPVIVVGVQTRERRAELTPRATDPRYIAAFPQSGGADRFRQFLRQEVIPFVAARVRTGARRAIMGESLAGLFIVDTLLREPALFNDYVAVSPSLWWDDRRALRTLEAAHAARLPSGTRLYLAIADEGGTMQDGVDRVRAWTGAAPPANLTTRYADFSRTATHATVYHRAAEDALRWLYPMPPDPGATTPWYMIDGAAPPTSARAPG